MANTRVSDFSSFINRQIESQENVESSLCKIEALMTVAVMTDGFCDLPEKILQPYFSVAMDYIEKAGEANQESISVLLKIMGKNEI
jgi:hypothetical protein